MKKLFSTVLAMLLALTMLTGALAEMADVTGDWFVSMLGIDEKLTLKENGTYTIDMGDWGSVGGVWEMQTDGSILMDKGTEDETVGEVTEIGLALVIDGMALLFTRGTGLIRTDATLEELQGEWVAKQVLTMGFVVDAEEFNYTCSLAVIDTSLHIHEVQGDTSVAETPFPMTFADGALCLEIPVDEAPQVWTIGLMADGRLSFCVNSTSTEVTWLMEKVAE